MTVEKKTKEGITVWKVDRNNKYYEYVFNPKCAQANVIKKLIFLGYTKKPTSLNSNGFGFARAMKPFYYTLAETFGEIESITVSDSVETKITKKTKRTSISIAKNDYEEYLASCNEIYRENSFRLKEISSQGLSRLFPKIFPVNNKSQYIKNTISKALQTKDIISNLSIQDIQEIAKIIPSLMDKSTTINRTVLDKLLFTDIKNKATKIKLTSIIKQYENLLAKKTQKESDWQTFLKENMLFFNSSYIQLIEKSNISTKITLPDFLLIDQFQFVDIFEIKRPDFECIKYDKSHDNYYWSEDASKAIAQVEKYIYEMENNANALIANFKEEGLDLKIIRPRGFVLISRRTLLTNPKSIKSFRLLSSTLKNVQVILYDDFLEAIKTKYSLIKI